MHLWFSLIRRDQGPEIGGDINSMPAPSASGTAMGFSSLILICQLSGDATSPPEAPLPSALMDSTREAAKASRVPKEEPTMFCSFGYSLVSIWALLEEETTKEGAELLCRRDYTAYLIDSLF